MLIRKLVCDMRHDCGAPITHIGEKGFIYCAEHSICRQGYERCRRLRPWEVKLLTDGKAIFYRPISKSETLRRLAVQAGG